MNTTSSSRAESPRKVLVWDAPVRIFHWLMVLCFAGAWLSAESERFRLLHVTLGYTMAGLVAFRLVWGLIGTRHARFASFVRGPGAVMRYLRSMLGGQPVHHVGHNPAGAIAILALLSMTVIVTAAGWATYNELGGEWLEELHEGAASAMLAVVVAHIAGVLLSSVLFREKLVGAMITGRKPARPEDGVRSAWRSVAAMMLVAVLGFWWLQWQGAPSGADASTSAAATGAPTAQVAKARRHDRDDD